MLASRSYRPFLYLNEWRGILKLLKVKLIINCDHSLHIIKLLFHLRSGIKSVITVIKRALKLHAKAGLIRLASPAQLSMAS